MHGYKNRVLRLIGACFPRMNVLYFVVPHRLVRIILQRIPICTRQNGTNTEKLCQCLTFLYNRQIDVLFCRPILCHRAAVYAAMSGIQHQRILIMMRCKRKKKHGLIVIRKNDR